jgi:hypothetical protein
MNLARDIGNVKFCAQVTLHDLARNSQKNSDGEGPDPEPWPIALDSLAIQAGRPLQPIYDSLGSVAEFPVRELSIVVKLQPAPQLPKVQLPKWSIKLIGIKDGHLEKTQQNLCPRDQTSKDASGRGRGMQLKEAEECHRPAQGDRRAARRSGT